MSTRGRRRAVPPPPGRAGRPPTLFRRSPRLTVRVLELERDALVREQAALGVADLSTLVRAKLFGSHESLYRGVLLELLRDLQRAQLTTDTTRLEIVTAWHARLLAIVAEPPAL